MAALCPQQGPGPREEVSSGTISTTLGRSGGKYKGKKSGLGKI